LYDLIDKLKNIKKKTTRDWRKKAAIIFVTHPQIFTKKEK
jgi:hypothetical protein